MRDADEVRRLRKQYGTERITLETRWGRRGLERAYNAHLHGVPGMQVKQLDKQGRFTKVRNGRFQVADDSRYNPERQAS